jgi:hypothetical protein
LPPPFFHTPFFHTPFQAQARSSRASSTNMMAPSLQQPWLGGWAGEASGGATGHIEREPILHEGGVFAAVGGQGAGGHASRYGMMPQGQHRDPQYRGLWWSAAATYEGARNRSGSSGSIGSWRSSGGSPSRGGSRGQLSTIDQYYRSVHCEFCHRATMERTTGPICSTCRANPAAMLVEAMYTIR